MSQIDLTMFKKNDRAPIRVSIYMGKLLHFMYLAVKNAPEESSSYESIEDAVMDRSFVEKVLSLERSTFTAEFEHALKEIEKRGYSGIIEYLNTVWEATATEKYFSSKKFFLELTGADPSSHIQILHLTRTIKPEHPPLIMKIRGFRFAVLEADFSSPAGLSRVLIYVGSAEREPINLGAVMRLSLATNDAKDLVDQQKRMRVAHLQSFFKCYPSLLRMTREAYKHVAAKSGFKDFLKRMVSDLYISSEELSAVMNCEFVLNIFECALPISLYGGVCLPVAFEGVPERIVHPYFIIRAGRCFLRAYPSFFSALDTGISSREPYIFLGFLPVTYPKIVLIAGCWPEKSFGEVEKEGFSSKKRAVSRFRRIFPSAEEVVKKCKKMQ